MNGSRRYRLAWMARTAGAFGIATVLCGNLMAADQKPPAERPRPAANGNVPLRNLDAMIEAARTDLAMRIGAKPEAVKVVSWAPVRLSLHVLHCEPGAPGAAEPAVPGYRIVLGYQGRDFTYQSDMKSAMACPRIERD